MVTYHGRNVWKSKAIHWKKGQGAFFFFFDTRENLTSSSHPVVLEFIREKNFKTIYKVKDQKRFY
jgi:hypothetical protein